jgi:hypothetical protein
MAIIMAGDINQDEMIKKIDQQLPICNQSQLKICWSKRKEIDGQ